MMIQEENVDKPDTPTMDVTLKVNGEAVRLNRFAQQVMGLAVFGMVGALKDVPEPKRAELSIRVR